MHNRLNVFVPITKVDAIKGIVYGTLAAEEPDRSKEIFDYAGSKPYFEKWSGAISKATDGKSLGNLRAMHGTVAAGKFTDMAFNDDGKKIEVAAKVVDKNELEKVLEGVYTGFSIGGSYVKRWKDGDLTRYIADPHEGSLVDLPCIESATFEVVKADGVLRKKFAPAGDVEAMARKLAKAADANADWHDFEADAIEALAKVAAEPKEPTNDEVAAEAKVIAKAAGDESGWLGFIEKARAKLKDKNEHGADAQHPGEPHGKGKDGKHPGENHGGAKPAKDKQVAGAQDELDDEDEQADADATQTGKAAGGDEPWTQVWEHPELPGKTFAKKGELRAALTQARADKAAKAAAGPVTDALKGLQDALGAKDMIKMTVTEAGNVAIDVVIKACGASDDDAAAATAYLKANASDITKAVGDAEIILNKDGTINAVSDALKVAVNALVDAALDDLSKREFSTDQRKKMASEGTAMKDGSYPIASKSDLKNAIQAYGRAKNKAAAKRHIIRRAKSLGATSMLPDDWHVKLAVDGDLKKIAAADLKKAASLYSAANLVQLLAAVESAEEGLESPSYGYATVVPKDLCDRFGTLLVELGDIVAEVLDECLQEIREEEAMEASGEMVERLAAVGDLVKSLVEGPLVKAGARHSKLDQNRLNDAHDLLVDAGAQCDGVEDEETGKGASVGALQKQLKAQEGAFAKTLDGIGKVLADVAERVKAIESQPLPEGTSHVTKGVFVVEKDGRVAKAGDGPMDDANSRAYAEMMGTLSSLNFRQTQVAPLAHTR